MEEPFRLLSPDEYAKLDTAARRIYLTALQKHIADAQRGFSLEATPKEKKSSTTKTPFLVSDSTGTQQSK